MVPEFADVTHTETLRGKVTPDVPGKGCAIFWVAAISAIITWIVFSFVAGLVIGAVLFVAGAYFFRPFFEDPGIKEPDKKITKTINKQVAEHRSCIQCRQPVEVL